jgi:hypothetical protein
VQIFEPVCLVVSCPQASRDGTDHVVSRQRPPDPLQLELTDRLDSDGVFDFRQHPRTNQDLPGLRFIAKARGNIGYRPNGSIIEAALITNRAKRSEAVRNPDAEANLVPEPTPPIGKFKFREAEAGRDLSARSRQLQLTFGTKYVAMEARYPLASARRNI